MGRKPIPPYDFSEKKPKKNGRPKKPDDTISLDRPRSSVKYDVYYAEKTIEKAEKIYRSYESPRPNPLNVDIKDLCKEAREAWKYVYSMREIDMDYLNHDQSTCGDITRTVDGPDEFLMLWESFCDYIRQQNFVRVFTRPDGTEGVLPIVPNQTSFSRWLGVSKSAINKGMREAEPAHYTSYKNSLADLISEGAMMGVYQNAMSIFTLKNMCDWADKFEDRPKQQDDTMQTLEEAKELIAKLGLVDRKLIGGGEEDGQTDSGTSDD